MVADAFFFAKMKGGEIKMENRKLKRVVIKEELVELTGDFKSAIVLNQLIYWSERTKDTDKFLNEERERIEKYGNYEFDSEKAEIIKDALTHGWIYKKASELAEDCMIGLSNATMGRILKNLIANGWIDERNNPIYKWDRTKQYRVNIAKIQSDLNKIGYALEGYSLGTACNNSFQNENSSFNHEKSNFQNEKLQIQNEKSELQNEKSQFQNEKAIPEITTEIKNTETIYKDSTTQFLACSDIKEDIKNAVDESGIKEKVKNTVKNSVEKIDNKLDNIRESVVSVSEMSDRFDDVESKIQNVSEDIDGLKSKIKDISEKLNIIDVQDNERMKEHKDNYSEIKNSVDEIAKSVSEVKQAFNSISKLNDSVFDLKNTQLNTKNTISELESSFVKLKKKCVLGVTVLSILSAIVIVLEVVLMLS